MRSSLGSSAERALRKLHRKAVATSQLVPLHRHAHVASDTRSPKTSTLMIWKASCSTNVESTRLQAQDIEVEDHRGPPHHKIVLELLLHENLLPHCRVCINDVLGPEGDNLLEIVIERQQAATVEWIV